ncbi:MAG: DUF2851 family protein [Proteiniphilum sp.]|nr:DUF2851 family protein [Proteiniphilum sp.]NCB24003.1 DUF2851 family protein [Bacteroidia bacterium]MDD2937563.1 DUF2851 family protein [Proteiniphilum sp.]MDD3075771.1 DUF2851 family protein [Proteiniphilum sp.]MDD3955793.1 DUF2851 family protein [Proteiniphilum sp.]
MNTNEQLLHYVWMFRLFPSASLKTVDGQDVEVIDPGMHNRDAGPDFFNAKIKIGDKVWAGNVEIHCSSDEWVKHGHPHDKAYNSVILHLAENVNALVMNQRGQQIPQCVLTVPDDIRANADYLLFSLNRIPCKQFLNILPISMLYSWLNALSVERLERKTNEIYAHLERFNHSWDETFYLLLTRNFGFGLNTEEFQSLALSLPFNYILRHSDNLLQIEALMFGQAGMLNEEGLRDTYYCSLKKEYTFLKAKYGLKCREDLFFKSMRIRPRSFPQLRIAQLASLLQRSGRLFSHILEEEEIGELRSLFHTAPSEYWETHYSFGSTSPKMDKQPGEASLDILLINTVVPMLFAYGRKTNSEKCCDRAIRLMEALKPERNSIVREFAQAGVIPRHAFDTQALIQLRKEYCDTRKCLYCRIGHKLLTSAHGNK